MIFLCVNPFSGSGQNRLLVEQLAHRLESHHGLASQIIDNPALRKQTLGDAASMRDCSCVVVAGGDGSVASAINDMHPDARSSVPLAVMSLGNENLLSRELGLHRVSIEAMAQAVAAGKTRRFDLGQANGRLFTLMVSAGMDADVVTRVEAWRQTPQGLRRASRASYARPILSAIRGYHYQPVELIPDDGQPIAGTHALVFNINRYAGGLSFAPAARSDDGLLDYVVLRKPGQLHAMRYLALVAAGRHLGCGDVCHGQARRILLRSNLPICVQADGDTIATTPVEVTLQPQAVSLIVP